jgi:hypothetical protein
MERIGISESRRVRGLGTNQVAALRKEFGTSSLGDLGASGLGNASPS